MNASIKKITIIYKKKTQIFLFLVERRNNKAWLYHEEKNSERGKGHPPIAEWNDLSFLSRSLSSRKSKDFFLFLTRFFDNGSHQYESNCDDLWRRSFFPCITTSKDK